MAQTVKNLPAMPETWVRSLGWEDPLEQGKATHSSVLAWRIPSTCIGRGGPKESDTAERLSVSNKARGFHFFPQPLQHLLLADFFDAGLIFVRVQQAADWPAGQEVQVGTGGRLGQQGRD